MSLAETLPQPPIGGNGMSGCADDYEYLASPHQREGYFLTPEADQQLALASIPRHEVDVVKRTTHKGPEHTASATYYEETVRYTDGTVRLMTLGVPKKLLCETPIVSGDPWCTSPSGFNRKKIETLTEVGIPVVWNHHQGRHAVVPNSRARIKTMVRSVWSKSLDKSAAQDHALLDNLSATVGFRTDSVIREGYSRPAMSGEAFIALAAYAGRHVVWSDLEAACYARRAGLVSYGLTVLRQLPHEIVELAGTAREIAASSQDPVLIHVTPRDYMGTLDLHLLNVIHEIGWNRPLVNGDAGKYAAAVPLNHKGVRTTYSHDYSGQQAEWKRIHRDRPGIYLLTLAGAHLSGARPSMLTLKRNRFARIVSYALTHDQDLSDIGYRDVLSSGEITP